MTKITAENLPRHELIGLRCKVIEATNTSLVGVEGTVVDETKNMIIIRDGKEWKVPKKEVMLGFMLGTEIKISGKSLVGRPEDRVKMHGNRYRC